MSFDRMPTSDLISIAQAGLGFSIHVESKPTNELIRIAEAAKLGGAKIKFINKSSMSEKDLKLLSEALGNQMKFVLYTSVLNHEGSDSFAVPQIIKTARKENNIHEISGVLLFDGANFTQYFEGNDDAVDQLLDNILRDKRHKNIVIVLSGELEERLYTNWEMGYIDISNQEVNIERCIASADFTIDKFQHKVSLMDIE